MLRKRINILTIRLAVRDKLREQGYTFSEINHVIGQITEDSILATAKEYSITEFGDGKLLEQILTAIVDFLKSPQGQKLIEALVAMLIALLSGL